MWPGHENINEYRNAKTNKYLMCVQTNNKITEIIIKITTIIIKITIQ